MADGVVFPSVYVCVIVVEKEVKVLWQVFHLIAHMWNRFEL
jgi:hypothetical protein